MGHYERTIGANLAGRSVLVSPADLISSVLAITDNVAYWDADPDNVSGVPYQFANRQTENAGALGALTQFAGYQNAVLETTELPPGGFCRQAIYMENTILTHTMPADPKAWTKVLVYRPARSRTFPTADGGLNMQTWSGTSVSTSHWLLTNRVGTVTASVGPNGGPPAASSYVGPGAWNYVITSWDSSTKAVSIKANGQNLAQTFGTTESNAALIGYIGGSSATFIGHVAAALFFQGTAGSSGDLFATGREADLALVEELCARICGSRNLS